MSKIYFTITGTEYRYGQAFIKPKMKVKLVKEPDNEYDKEAIKVETEGMGQIGYVANSPYTVVGDSMSAGRLYDKIGDTAVGKVKYVTSKGVVCFIKVKDKQAEHQEKPAKQENPADPVMTQQRNRSSSMGSM